MVKCVFGEYLKNKYIKCIDFNFLWEEILTLYIECKLYIIRGFTEVKFEFIVISTYFLGTLLNSLWILVWETMIKVKEYWYINNSFKVTIEIFLSYVGLWIIITLHKNILYMNINYESLLVTVLDLIILCYIYICFIKEDRKYN